MGRYGIPDLFAPAAATIAKLVANDDLLARSPLWGVQQLNGRAIFITHGTADKRLSVQYASDLAAAVNASGGQVEPWIIEGAAHVQAMWMHSDEYEQKLVAFFTTSLG